MVDVTASTGLENTSGWWNSLAADDFDRDGDMDYVAGNLGLNTKYEASPAEPVRIHAKDFDQNGELDLLMVGNSYAPDVRTGRADASVGAFLKGGGTGHFTYLDYTESGSFVDGDARGLAEVATDEGSSLVLATQNSGPLKAFSYPRRGRRTVRLRPLNGYALLTFEGGTTRRQEFYYGSGYLSQSSRILHLPEEVEKVVVYDYRGNRRTVSVHEFASTGAADGGDGL